MAFGIDIGSAIGGIASGAMSARAAREATEKQIEWERERATHAHQWEVQDLKAAGLNPILSAGGQGAVTGSISAPMPDYSGIANISQSSSAAEQARTAKKAQKSQEKLNEAAVKQAQAHAKLAENQATNSALDTQIKSAEFDAKKPMLDAEKNYRNSTIGRGLTYAGMGGRDIAPLANILSLGIGGLAIRHAFGKATTALKAGQFNQATQAIQRSQLPPKGRLIERRDRGLSAQERWEHIPAMYWRPQK